MSEFQQCGRLVTSFLSIRTPLACIMLATAATLGSQAFAGTYGMDPSFGTGGRQLTDFGQAETAYAIEIQPDGKIVAAGGSGDGRPGLAQSLALARYLPDGSLDPSFAGGKVLDATRKQSYSIALQPDGKVVTASGYSAFVLYRHNPDGSPDSTFNSSSTFVGEGRSLLIQPDGKLVTSGKVTFCEPPGPRPPRCQEYWAVGRNNADGSADASFQGGVAYTITHYGIQTAIGVALQPDGRIVTVGYGGSTGADFILIRYNTDGTIEYINGFNLGGSDLRGQGTHDVATSVALQPDGKILLAGMSGTNSAVVRFTTPGVFDSSFGTQGKALVPGAPIRAIALQADGKIVALTETFELLRFTANGQLDPAFGSSGRLAVPMGAGALGWSMKLMADNRIVVGGSASNGASFDFAVARIAKTPLHSSRELVEFGGQSMGTTSPAQVLTIVNTTGSTMTISSVAVSTYFSVSHDCATLAPAASCTASVLFNPSADGLVGGTLTFTSDAGTETVLLAGVGERSLVTHYYRTILRRAPDAAGKSFWDAEAVRVQSLGINVNEVWFAMAAAFYGSAEYLALNRDNAGFVTDLYATFFNRAPDAEGFADWTGKLDAGMPREVVLASFMFSPEFTGFTQAIFGPASVRKEIDMVGDFFRGLLARLPDDAGFTFWLQQFRAAQCQGTPAVVARAAAISSQFTQGSEYLARARTNEQYVGDLYNAFLRRGGDLAGVQFWINQIATGTRTRENVRLAFVGSREFSARVVAVAAEGCL